LTSTGGLRSRRMHFAADDTLKRRCAMWKTRPFRLHLPGIAPLRRLPILETNAEMRA
jgi:hypothetical protein